MRNHRLVLAASSGAQQRDRHALSKAKPYRWHGKPGWNPALALAGWRSKDRKTRACRECAAQPGEQCHTRDGRVMARSNHDGR